MSRIERVDFGLGWSWGGILEVMRGSDARLRAIASNCEWLALKGCRSEWFMRRVFVIERV